MDLSGIRHILEQIENGSLKVDEALNKLRHLPFADFDISKHDSHRCLRNEFSEVILCEGKDPIHLIKIVDSLAEHGHNVFGTRANPETAKLVVDHFAKSGSSKVDYDPISRTFHIINRQITPVRNGLAIVCAGTADLPVAEEARRTAEYFGFEAQRFYDVGVAGLHRLISCLDDLKNADCAIVVAGMEGALPSVVGGLVACPIVACPTSVGYGANLKGFTALLAMLNSCSEGISVVNIDNGFGAACAAIRILRKLYRT